MLLIMKKIYLSNNDKSMLFTIAYMLEIIICNDNEEKYIALSPRKLTLLANVTHLLILHGY